MIIELIIHQKERRVGGLFLDVDSAVESVVL